MSENINATDISISGSGVISKGEYRNINISGSAKANEALRCRNLHVSGSCKLAGVECEESVKVSGSLRASEEVKAETIRVSGGLHCDKGLEAEKISVSGGLHSEQIKGGSIRISGGIKVEKDVEAEEVEVSGQVKIGGLLNAEKITIELEGKTESHVGSIGCSELFVKPGDHHPGFIGRLFDFDGKAGVLIADVIEGDELDLTNVVADTVRGKNIKIREGCRIRMVEYTESCGVSPKAKIKEHKKTE